MRFITTQKVAHIAIRAREFDVKVGRWGGRGDSSDAEAILESRSGDATEGELRAFIARLNEDEKAELTAIMWVGRGTFEAEELSEAYETAKAEAVTPTEDYLLGEPMLADYLEAGLEKFGFDVSDLEDEIYRSG